MQYRYSGPLTSMTLPDGRDVILIDGQTVDLPEDNPVVQTLEAIKRLAPQAASAPKAAKTKGE